MANRRAVPAGGSGRSADESTQAEAGSVGAAAFTDVKAAAGGTDAAGAAQAEVAETPSTGVESATARLDPEEETPKVKVRRRTAARLELATFDRANRRPHAAFNVAHDRRAVLISLKDLIESRLTKEIGAAGAAARTAREEMEPLLEVRARIAAKLTKYGGVPEDLDPFEGSVSRKRDLHREVRTGEAAAGLMDSMVTLMNRYIDALLKG